MRKCTIRLTESATRYAMRHHLEEELAKLGLGAESLVGDIVSLETGERPHDFLIMRRRWVMTSDDRQLEFMLDHPVRTARP